MFIVIENDGCTPDFFNMVAHMFQRYCHFAMENTPGRLNLFNFLPEETDHIQESDENSVFPFGYHESCRYHNQNKSVWENCIVLNYYLVNNEYWPRHQKPDIVFIIGGQNNKSETYKKIYKVANAFYNTRVVYLTCDIFACSEQEKMRMISFKMFIAATNEGHVFREDFIASENV